MEIIGFHDPQAADHPLLFVHPERDFGQEIDQDVFAGVAAVLEPVCSGGLWGCAAFSEQQLDETFDRIPVQLPAVAAADADADVGGGGKVSWCFIGEEVPQHRRVASRVSARARAA